MRAQATKRSCSSCPSMTTPVAEGEGEVEAAIHRANFELLQTLQITHCDEWKSGRLEDRLALIFQGLQEVSGHSRQTNFSMLYI